MIAPQKFSKSLGKNKFKIGLSMKELTFVCAIAPVCTILGVDELISFSGAIIFLLSMMVKNLLFEPNYLQNTLERKSHLKWERVKVRIDD
jgi:hypothetical protein